MNFIPTTIEGIPLAELIGKEVIVDIVSGETPLLKLMNSQRKNSAEILRDIQFIASTGDFKLIILIIKPNKISRHGNSWLSGYSWQAAYSCLYSNVQLTYEEEGKTIDLDSHPLQELLQLIELTES